MIDFNNIFDVSYKQEQSQELFGFGNKKKEPTPRTLEDIKKSPKYDPNLPKKLFNEYKRAWNYQAYKLPKGFTEKDYKEYYGSSKYKEIYDKCHENEYEYGNDIGFYNKIHEMKGEEYGVGERIGRFDGKYQIEISGIFEFAYGQPTNHDLYYDVLYDISERWEARLKEKTQKLMQSLSQSIPGITIDVCVDTGDGDEGCVYPTIFIDIPTSYFIDEDSTEGWVNILGSKDYFHKSGEDWLEDGIKKSPWYDSELPIKIRDMLLDAVKKACSGNISNLQYSLKESGSKDIYSIFLSIDVDVKKKIPEEPIRNKIKPTVVKIIEILKDVYCEPMKYKLEKDNGFWVEYPEADLLDVGVSFNFPTLFFTDYTMHYNIKNRK